MKKVYYSFLFLCFVFIVPAQDIFDAARKGNCDQLNKLFQLKPDTIHQKNQNGFTPLILACYNHQKEAAEWLIKKGVNLEVDSPEGPALLAAVYKNNIEIANMLLVNGANVNAINNEGTTALMYACMAGNSKMVNLLISKGADKTKLSKHGHTALTLAKKYGFTEIETLLSHQSK